jgi:phosphohistidine phosphatase
MNLYLIRHAEAAPLGADGVTCDEDRPLTDAGRVQAKSLGASFRKRGLRFDAIVTSPLLRARQTSDEFVAALKEPAPPVLVFDEIGFEVRPRKICKYLIELPASDAVAIVGHQPGLSRFAAWLAGSKKAQIDLAKAGFAHLTCDEPDKGAAELIALVPPEWQS